MITYNIIYYIMFYIYYYHYLYNDPVLLQAYTLIVSFTLLDLGIKKELYF